MHLHILSLLITYPHHEHKLKELNQIYIQRGLNAELAHEVTVQLTAYHALEAYARDEIGIHENTAVNPLQVTGSSTLAFSMGALFLMFLILN
jgi:vacuolar iron transporter family protein